MTNKPSGIRVSIVMPCLNEAPTIGQCIANAKKGLAALEMPGEILVADNGSTDGSVEIAQKAGAKVVHQPEKGYGNAYLKGIQSASGEYIIIGDSDGTYNFEDAVHFITPLENGYDMVMGNRFKGKIHTGAMPWHHQYIGNPVLSGILNLFYKTGIGDAHCGIRAFTKQAFTKMHIQATGMEFASEMVINATLAGLKITEIPVEYKPRPQGSTSKLRSFRDGWRHLRFMLLYSPTWLFMVPGTIMCILGMILMLALVWGPVEIGPLYFDIHFLVLGSLLALLGIQITSLGIYTYVLNPLQYFKKTTLINNWLKHRFSLERGVLMGSSLLLVGLIINILILYQWLASNFGALARVREAILAMTLMVIGVQTIFASFYITLLDKQYNAK